MIKTIIFDINTLDNGVIYQHIRYINIGYGDNTTLLTLCKSSHAVTGAGHAPDGLRRRSEIAGQFEHHQTVLRQFIIDLDNLDATLRLFVPDIELEATKTKPISLRHAAFRGEVARIIFGALRVSPGPMTTHQLAQQVMAERGLNTADKKLVKAIGKRVGLCLRHHRSRELVRSIKGPESFLLWEIAN